MKIIAVTGASGGHIFPALSFLEELKEKHSEIEVLLVLPKRSVKKKIIPENIFKIKYISTSGLTFTLGSLFNFLLGSAQSLELLLKFKPDLVVGFGSADSLPLVFLAWLLRIKTLIHEQNVLPGKANKILAKLVDKVAVSFPQTSEYLSINPSRITVTGNPIRKDLVNIEKDKALNFFGFCEKFTLLVIGGSQGSHRMNLALLKAFSTVDKNFPFQVIHITGLDDAELIKKGYEKLKIKAKVFSFLSQINYAYSASDLVISRAGGSAIYELIFFRKPAILIPYPFAYAHQLKNAQVLKNLGSALIVRDNDLDYDLLKNNIENLFFDPEKLSAMRACYGNMVSFNASNLLVNLALELAGVNRK